MHPMKKAIEITISTPICPISSMPIPDRIACGICAKEMIHEKAAPAATRMKTTAVIRPVDFAVS